MSDLVGNPEDRFSHNGAHMIQGGLVAIHIGSTVTSVGRVPHSFDPKVAGSNLTRGEDVVSLSKTLHPHCLGLV